MLFCINHIISKFCAFWLYPILYVWLLVLQNYIVTQVCSHLTSSSPFPSEDYTSYEHYYSQKYELDIMNKHQPLLEVKAIPNQLNCLRPKYVSYLILYKLAQLKFNLWNVNCMCHSLMQFFGSRGTKVSSATSRRKRHELQEDFEENLVAELCVRFAFPSVLWLKATCLPSILHRITSLLLAEELRQNIVRDIGVGCVELPPGEMIEMWWRNLLVGVSWTQRGLQ